MKEIVSYMKVFIKGAFFLLTILFTGIAVFSGFYILAGNPSIGEAMGLMALALVFVLAGGSCFWSGLSLAQGDEMSLFDKKRCFVGGFPLLLIGFIVFGAIITHAINPKILPETTPVLIPWGMVWLWVAIELLRGKSVPVANFEVYIAGNVLLVISMLIAVGVAVRIEEEYDWLWRVLMPAFFALVVFMLGALLLRFGEPPQKSFADTEFNEEDDSDSEEDAVRETSVEAIEESDKNESGNKEADQANSEGGNDEKVQK